MKKKLFRTVFSFWQYQQRKRACETCCICLYCLWLLSIPYIPRTASFCWQCLLTGTRELVNYKLIEFWACQSHEFVEYYHKIKSWWMLWLHKLESVSSSLCVLFCRVHLEGEYEPFLVLNWFSQLSAEQLNKRKPF